VKYKWVKAGKFDQKSIPPKNVVLKYGTLQHKHNPK
jgi:hypothetical protein